MSMMFSSPVSIRLSSGTRRDRRRRGQLDIAAAGAVADLDAVDPRDLRRAIRALDRRRRCDSSAPAACLRHELAEAQHHDPFRRAAPGRSRRPAKAHQRHAHQRQPAAAAGATRGQPLRNRACSSCARMVVEIGQPGQDRHRRVHRPAAAAPGPLGAAALSAAADPPCEPPGEPQGCRHLEFQGIRERAPVGPDRRPALG